MTARVLPPLGRRLLAEFAGTALLVAVVVGSGIAGQRPSPDDVGLQPLYNSTATVFGLGTLILLFGPVSGRTSTPPCRPPTGCWGAAPRSACPVATRARTPWCRPSAPSRARCSRT